MISAHDWPRLTLLLLVTIAMGDPHREQTQDLALTADVGKTLFFEDEPIFLVLRLTNVGSDTIWVMDFSAISQAVQLSVRRDGGEGSVGGFLVGLHFPDEPPLGGSLAAGISPIYTGDVSCRA